jgi:uncharacterized coiled-coil protein SlyX
MNNLSDKILSLQSRNEELTEQKTKPIKKHSPVIKLRKQGFGNSKKYQKINNLIGEILSLENQNKELKELLLEQINIKGKVESERKVAFNQKKSKNGKTKVKGNTKLLDLKIRLSKVNNSISSFNENIKNNKKTISRNQRNLEMLRNTL